MTAVKICGIKSIEDGVAAVEAGAQMIGFIFYRPVRRYVEPRVVASIVAEARRLGHAFEAVGVFVNEAVGDVNAIAVDCGLDAVQLAGDEDAAYIRELRVPAIKVLRRGEEPWMAARLEAAERPFAGVAARYMVDSHVDGFYGGTGVTGDWDALAGSMVGKILAGGLRPDNVAAAIAKVRPWGVDVSSGVEIDGRKDHALIRDFIQAVRFHDAASLTAA